ncbi:tetratricopeptide repeat protein [Nitrosococcus wardiae]|uniref:Tetratricopeptide repeat protein n=1 Tax=Nitrosococcus wardiae TaxID=1814290 RepID=A0A4P7BVF5_9GAMM|nr:tetratricopeptide repeat protein [Nitrosococcus wardiae]QBQ53267.1 tetratricopeptide repeat protein [Nitrosococcus wardiae]
MILAKKISSLWRVTQRPYIGLILVLLLAWGIYAPGLYGGFLFDDEHNITDNTAVQIEELSVESLWQAAFSTESGPLKRPLSLLSFAFNHYISGLDPYAFKLVNLFVHLATGILVYLAVWQLLAAYRRCRQKTLNDITISWMSFGCAALWLLHPLNLTPVLYVVQRMTSLAAFFTFAGLGLYAWGRRRQMEGKNGWIAIGLALFIALPLGALSKENALLLPLFILLAELTLFQFSAVRQSTRRLLIAGNLLIVVLPVILGTLYLLFYADWWLRGYEIKEFTLGERLLTEARVFWYYLQLIFFPRLANFGLYHDDFAISHGWLEPTTTLPAVLGVMALGMACLLLRKRAPVFAFGLGFFLIGHSMESTIFSLELVHEHRNYTPLFGIALMLAYGVGVLIPQRSLRIFVASTILVLLSTITAIRADIWGNPLEHLLVSARHHPHSARTHYDAGRLFFQLALAEKAEAGREVYYQRGKEFFSQAYRNDPRFLSAPLAMLAMDHALTKPVDEAQVKLLAQELATTPLTPFTIHNLQKINKCYLEKQCQWSQEHLGMFFSAAIENPALVHQAKTVLLTEYSIFLLAKGDLSQALQLAEKAKKVNPKDPQLALNYAALLRYTGRYQEAQAEYAALGALPLSDLHARRLQGEKKALEELLDNLDKGVSTRNRDE